MSLSAKPASAITRRMPTLWCVRITSMQFQDEVVHVRPDADDDLAQNVQELRVLGVDRRVARRTRGEEKVLVLVRDVELDREALRRRREHAAHRYGSARKNLAGARGPDDRVDLGLDDLPRIGLQRELGFVSGLDLVQLVLPVESDDAAGRLGQRHHRIDGNSGNEATGPKLQVDDVAIARRTGRGLVEVPFRAFELSADLRDLRVL